MRHGQKKRIDKLVLSMEHHADELLRQTEKEWANRHERSKFLLSIAVTTAVLEWLYEKGV